MKKFTNEELKLLRKSIPKNIAEEIVSVQPIPPIDFHKIAEDPLWQSYVDRHYYIDRNPTRNNKKK